MYNPPLRPVARCRRQRRHDWSRWLKVPWLS